MNFFYIWSIEHNAWWKSNSMGYTRNLTEAGAYDEGTATRIVRNANIRSFNECMIPVECLFRVE